MRAYRGRAIGGLSLCPTHYMQTHGLRGIGEAQSARLADPQLHGDGPMGKGQLRGTSHVLPGANGML